MKHAPVLRQLHAENPEHSVSERQEVSKTALLQDTQHLQEQDAGGDSHNDAAVGLKTPSQLVN